MNGKAKKFFKIGLFWRVIGVIILLGIIGAICYGRYWQVKYVSISAGIEAADGDEFVRYIERHNDTAVGVHDDIVSTRIELQSAAGYAADLEQRIGRAYDIAKQSDDEFVEFRNAMASPGSTISALIANQQRINDIVGRIEKNNNAIKAEFGVRP